MSRVAYLATLLDPKNFRFSQVFPNFPPWAACLVRYKSLKKSKQFLGLSGCQISRFENPIFGFRANGKVIGEATMEGVGSDHFSKSDQTGGSSPGAGGVPISPINRSSLMGLSLRRGRRRRFSLFCASNDPNPMEFQPPRGSFCWGK